MWSDTTTKRNKLDLRDSYYWYHCTTQEKVHDLKHLILTQIIPGDAMEMLNKQLHVICKKWKIHDNCSCDGGVNGIKKEIQNELDASKEDPKREEKEKQFRARVMKKSNISESRALYPTVKIFSSSFTSFF